MMQDDQVIDCGSNSCRFAPTRTGMRTNGGCRCFERAGFHPSAVQAASQMLPEVLRLRAAVEAAHHYVDAKLAANDAEPEARETLEDYAEGAAWDRMTEALCALNFDDMGNCATKRSGQ